MGLGEWGWQSNAANMAALGLVRVRDLSLGDTRISMGIDASPVPCKDRGQVKCERLDLLASKPFFYTMRIACYAGRGCRHDILRNIARDRNLDWGTIKTPGKHYLCAQFPRVALRSYRRDSSPGT